MIRLILYIFVLTTALRLQVAKLFSDDDDPSVSLELDRLTEAQRRLRMLGDTVARDFNKHVIRTRARDVFVDPDELERWWRFYNEGGLEALKPDWVEIGKFAREIVAERYSLLGVYADQEYLDSDDIRT